MLFEIVIDSVEGAVAAQAAGAQRVELCQALVEGGLTPSLGLLQVVRQRVSLGVMVMVRPRGGDFCYTEAEFAVMQQDIAAAKAAGADGIVLGLLLPDGRVDVERARALVARARPLPVTFHRAFDMTRDAGEALEALCDLGIERVLTSGQHATALEGKELIARLVQQAGERITILAGGGVSAENVAEIVSSTGVREVHFGGSKQVDSPMTFRNTHCAMGKAYQPQSPGRGTHAGGDGGGRAGCPACPYFPSPPASRYSNSPSSSRPLSTLNRILTRSTGFSPVTPPLWPLIYRR